MGKLFSIDAGTKAVITDALDDIIGEFGKRCRLVHPPAWVGCENCHADPLGKKSANRWRHGGPMRFQAGSVCPLCRGQGGHHAAESGEEILLKVEWEPGRFWSPFPGVDVRAPFSFCQTKGYMSDFARLSRADHLVLQLPVEGVVRAKFRLTGAPVSPGNIIQDRYLVANWEARG